ncbi:MAG: hypothetical protein LBJ32_00860, partial [Oscillospiraceae bacterium]|nr:hypothetical protein [Oscillospiraceae bacterium]
MEDNYFGKFLMIVIPFSKVLENEELCNELAKLNSYEEIYEFLLSIEDTGYTKEDVYNFCNFLIKKFEENKYEILASINDNTSDNDDTSKIQLNDDEISNVSGGSLKNQKSKFTATALAALSAITPFINSKISAVNANNPVIQSVAIEKDDRTKEAPKITGALAAQSKTVDKTKKEVSKTTGAPASQSKTVDKTKKEAPKTTGAPSTQSKTVDKTKKEAPKTAGAPSTQSKAINKIKEVAKTANSPVAQSKAIDKTKEVPKTASTPAAQSKAVDKTKKEAPKTADAPVAQSKAVNKTEKNVNVLVKEKKSTILSQLKQFWEDYGKTAAKLTIGTIIVCGSLYLSSVAIDKFQKYDVNKKFHKGLDDRPLVKKLYDEEKDKAGNEQLSDKQIMNNVGYVFENDSNSKSIAVSQINEVIKILNEAKSPLNILYDIFKGMFTPVTLFFGITQSISS